MPYPQNILWWFFYLVASASGIHLKTAVTRDFGYIFGIRRQVPFFHIPISIAQLFLMPACSCVQVPPVLFTVFLEHLEHLAENEVFSGMIKITITNQRGTNLEHLEHLEHLKLGQGQKNNWKANWNRNGVSASKASKETFAPGSLPTWEGHFPSPARQETGGWLRK